MNANERAVEAMKAGIDGRKVNVHPFPPAEKAKLIKAGEKFIDEWRAKTDAASYDSKRILASYQALDLRRLERSARPRASLDASWRAMLTEPAQRHGPRDRDRARVLGDRARRDRGRVGGDPRRRRADRRRHRAAGGRPVRHPRRRAVRARPDGGRGRRRCRPSPAGAATSSSTCWCAGCPRGSPARSTSRPPCCSSVPGADRLERGRSTLQTA